MSTIEPPRRYTVGLDLGKLQDYTALAVVEEAPASWREDLARAVAVPRWADDPDFAVPWLQRWPLQTPYHAIAADVAGLVADLHGRVPRPEVALFVDATGVGTAVVEMLRAAPALAALGRRFVQAVTITAGNETSRTGDGWHVPKKELVAAAQVALQRGKLKVAAQLPEAATLTAELRAFEVRITASAQQTFNAREGQHDDLVLGVALALWGALPARRPQPLLQYNYRTGR